MFQGADKLDYALETEGCPTGLGRGQGLLVYGARPTAEGKSSSGPDLTGAMNAAEPNGSF